MADATTPHELLELLRSDILAAADDDETDVDAAEGWADEHLDGLTAAHVTGPARDLVGALLAGSVDDLGFPAPSETAVRRERLLEALDRGLLANARRGVLLPPLLAEARVGARLSRRQVALELGISEDEFAALENGSTPIVQEDPMRVAAWIHHLGLNDDDSVAALGRSVDQAADGNYALAAGGTARVSGDNAGFVGAVRDQLAKLRALN